MSSVASPIQVAPPDGLLIYGKKECARCKASHTAESWLKETWKTRFNLLRFAAEMMADKSRTKQKTWADMTTLKDKLKGLRSSRNGLPLFDPQTAKTGGPTIRKEILDTLTFFEKEGYQGLTCEDLYAAMDPTEYDSKGKQKGPLALDRFRSVLSDMERSNLRVEGTGAGKRYWRGDISGPARKIDPTYDDRNSHLLGSIHEMTKDTTGEFMLGILMCPEKTFITASGKGINSGVLKNVRKTVFPKWVECAPRTKEGTHKSRVGKVIPSEMYGGCQAEGATPPGNCAAPRLLEQAFGDAAVDNGKFAQWAMSEIWYLPSTSNRSSSDLAWTHGITAESCATCAKLVPLLLCPAT